jgi:hypothetical protein
VISLGLSYLSSGTAALALALAASPARGMAAPPRDSESEVPGGYYEAMDLRGDDEPPDGDKKVTLGSVLFALGLIQTGGGVSSYLTATPRYCSSVYGANVTDSTCSGLRIYGIVGIAFGGLMTVTGATFLGWGLIERQRHRKWMRERGFSLGPMLGPGQHGLTLGFRF